MLKEIIRIHFFSPTTVDQTDQNHYYYWKRSFNCKAIYCILLLRKSKIVGDREINTLILFFIKFIKVLDCAGD